MNWFFFTPNPQIPQPMNNFGFGFVVQQGGPFFKTFACKERLAKDMLATLPMNVICLISGAEWKGGPLVDLPNPLGRPSAAVLAKNYVWLLPFVKDSPAKARIGISIYQNSVCYPINVDSGAHGN